MNASKDRNKIYAPEALLKSCLKNEDFVEIFIIGTKKDGTASWFTSTKDISFMSLVYFSVLGLTQGLFKTNEFKES